MVSQPLVSQVVWPEHVENPACATQMMSCPSKDNGIEYCCTSASSMHCNGGRETERDEGGRHADSSANHVQMSYNGFIVFNVSTHSLYARIAS